MTTITLNMPEADYRALPGVSGTAIADLLRSPAVYAWKREHPTESTPAMALGTFVHALVLGQPHTFIESDYADFRTKAAQEWKAAQTAAGMTVVTDAVWTEAHAIAEAVLLHPDAQYLLDLPGESELTVTWDEGGVPCKGRIDRLAQSFAGGAVVIDVKTTRDLDDFAKSIGNYGYHTQACHYRRGVIAQGQLTAVRPMFIVVETSAPYRVQVFQLSEADAAQGDAGCVAAYRVWADCTEADAWPSGLPEGVTQTAIPSWSARQWDDRIARIGAAA